MQNNDALVVPFFRTTAVQNMAASKAAGRPIFKDIEVVEIRIAGDRNFAPIHPAHSMWKRINGEEITYARRWPEQYARFKASQEQIAEGTPISELPFLSEAKRAELRGLKIYTAEALASLEGKNLTVLGAEGRDMKARAAAYMDRAGGSAKSVALAAENEALRAQIAALQAGESKSGDGAPAADPAPAPASGKGAEEKPADDLDEEAEKISIKAQIKELTGNAPRGAPSLETLRAMLADLKDPA